MQPRKHAAAMHAYADGAEIQWRNPRDLPPTWTDFLAEKGPSWQDDIEYRVKPAAPKYPASEMSVSALRAIWDKQWGACRFDESIARAVADAAVLHMFESGAAVPAADYDNVAVRLAHAKMALFRAGFTNDGGEDWMPPTGGPRVLIPVSDATRDMAVAYAVRGHIITECIGYIDSFALQKLRDIDVASIVAKVP